MAPAKRQNLRRDWYIISVDSVRALGIVLVSLAGFALAFFVFRELEQAMRRRDINALIAEAKSLAVRLNSSESASAYARDIAQAEKATAEAERLLTDERFASARTEANRARNVLAWIVETLESGGASGEATVIHAAGEVEYRRGESGDWRSAGNRTVLALGDYVRTAGSGSAQIMYADGSYVSVRPSTMFRIQRAASSESGRHEPSIRMEYGWVNLTTRQNESNVTTPESEAWVEQHSEAAVAYDRGTSTARYVNYSGGVRLAAKDGSESRVEPAAQVVHEQAGSFTSGGLPPRPQLLEPADNVQLDRERNPRLILAWQPIPASSRYALQVSRGASFTENVIDASNRTKTTATLGLRGEGAFEWRVAAIGRDGVQGPWSAPRRFRVGASAGSGVEDKTPPLLTLRDLRSYGAIFIVGGSTEPGSEVEINGEPVAVAADGSFNKTLQLTQEGWRVLTVRARDSWGNVTERPLRVFVEGL